METGVANILLKTLILDNATLKKIVGIKDALKAVELAFRYLGENKVKMPPKIYLHLDKYKGDFRAMPAYLEGFRACGIKWVNVHPENKRKGLSTVMALIILNDATSGFPLCVLDGTYLTALRTGAAGGIAAKYLARKNSCRIALVGCGVQATTQLLALKEIFKIKEVNVWGPDYQEASRFIRNMQRLKKMKIRVCCTIQDCVKDCDIVVTTTPSRKPLVKLAWLKKSVHINAMGADAPGKQELEPAILKKAKIIVDSLKQASHSGEINVPLAKGQITPKDIYADIGDIVTGRKVRPDNQEITLFDSTGLAVQDVAIANIAYRKAIKLKKGVYIKLI